MYQRLVAGAVWGDPIGMEPTPADVQSQWGAPGSQTGAAGREPPVTIVEALDWPAPTIMIAARGFTTPLHAQIEDLALIDWLYRFQDYQDVSDFLRARPYLIQLLSEAYANIRRLFPPSSQLVLEVVRDPEGDSSGRLFLYIQAPLTVEAAYSLLQRIDDEWWLEAATRSRCQLTIDVDYTICSTGPTF